MGSRLMQIAFDASMAKIIAQAGLPDRVVVGFSGGVDSVALLDLAKTWADGLGVPVRLVAAHLNHGIRGADADADEEFCRDFSARLNVEFRAEKVDVPGLARERRLGLEEAGRLARLAFFLRVGGGGKPLVLTAHHADDQAETILLHLRRGAHRRGLSGMKAVSALPVPPDQSILVGRPLLAFPKADIARYAAGRGLSWREDATNADESFARNKIRHSIIPALESILPGFRNRLLAKAETLAAEEEALSRAAKAVVDANSRRENGGRLFRLDGGALEQPERLLYAFRHILEEELGGRLPYGALLSRLAVLAESGKTGDGLSLPGGLQVRREQDGLFFHFPGKEQPGGAAAEIVLPDPPFEIEANGLVVKAEWLPLAGQPPGDDMLDPEVEWMNPAAIKWPLTLRPPSPGERFRPLGAPGSRKLQDVMTDLKLPQRKRGEARVLADHVGAIWLWPYRLAHRVRLEGIQVKALRVSIREKEAEG